LKSGQLLIFPRIYAKRVAARDHLMWTILARDLIPCDDFQVPLTNRKDSHMETKNSNGIRASLVAMALLSTGLAAGARAEGDSRESQDKRGDGDFSESQIKRGFAIVPPGVFLNLAGKNRALVGLGSYIVNTTGCNDCHTHPSYLPAGDPFKGFPEMINFQHYLTGGRQFGPFTSANLTPDASGNPAGLTLRQFIRTLRTGHNPNDPPGQILQVMPWPVYGKKTDQDLTAIYEYLRAIPSLPNNPSPGP
jgi:hypothetical protein